MEVKFNVVKEERKALVAAASEIMGVKAEYQGAPSFAFKVNGHIIDKNGTMSFGERTDADIRALLTALEERGFVPAELPDGLETVESVSVEAAVGEVAEEATHQNGEVIVEEAADESGKEMESQNRTPSGGEEKPSQSDTAFIVASDSGFSVIETPDTLVIELPLAGFTRTALDNLEKIVAGKWELILKAIGVPESDNGTDLPIEETETSLRFPWFPLPASKAEIDAYGKFVFALCEMAKKQKRVTMKDADVESEKYAMRCFLLRLGFIGNEYKSARRILLSKLSGGGSFKSGNHKKAAAPEAVTAADSGGENTEAITVRKSGNDADGAPTGGEAAAPPSRCQECLQHCYYTVGTLRTSTGDVVNTSNRTPESYTHYCLGTPSGFRKIKSASDWSGTETPTAWCPLLAVSNSIQTGGEKGGGHHEVQSM